MDYVYYLSPHQLTTHVNSSIVNGDMVWRVSKFQSVYNELQCYVEATSPCTNLLKFCLLIFQHYG